MKQFNLAISFISLLAATEIVSATETPTRLHTPKNINKHLISAEKTTHAYLPQTTEVGVANDHFPVLEKVLHPNVFLPPRLSANGYVSDYLVGQADLMVSVAGDYGHNLYIDPNVAYASDTQGYADIGVGYRWIRNNHGTRDNASILGVYLFGGYARIDNNARLWIANPGVEALASRWDLHVNGYFPLGKRSLVVHEFFGEGIFSGHALLGSHHELSIQKIGNGGDVQVGYQVFPGSSLKATAGSYFFSPQGASNVWGGIAGLEYWWDQHLKVFMAYSHDNLQGSVGAVGLGIEFGGVRTTRIDPIPEERIMDPVVRYLAGLGRGSTIPSRTLNSTGTVVLEDNIAFFRDSGNPGTPNNGGVGLNITNCTFENPCGPTDLTDQGASTLSGLLPNTKLYFNGGDYDALNVLGGTNPVTLQPGQSVSSRTPDYMQPVTVAEGGASTFNGGFILNDNNSLGGVIVLPSIGFTGGSGVQATGSTGIVITDSQIGSVAQPYPTGISLISSQATVNNTPVTAVGTGVSATANSVFTMDNSPINATGAGSTGIMLDDSIAGLTDTSVTAILTGISADNGSTLTVTQSNPSNPHSINATGAGSTGISLNNSSTANITSTPIFAKSIGISAANSSMLTLLDSEVDVTDPGSTGILLNASTANLTGTSVNAVETGISAVTGNNTLTMNDSSIGTTTAPITGISLANAGTTATLTNTTVKARTTGVSATTNSTLTTNPTTSIITATASGSTGIVLNAATANLAGTAVLAFDTGISAVGSTLNLSGTSIDAFDTGISAVAGTNTLTMDNSSIGATREPGTGISLANAGTTATLTNTMVKAGTTGVSATTNSTLTTNPTTSITATLSGSTGIMLNTATANLMGGTSVDGRMGVLAAAGSTLTTTGTGNTIGTAFSFTGIELDASAANLTGTAVNALITGISAVTGNNTLTMNNSSIGATTVPSSTSIRLANASTTATLTNTTVKAGTTGVSATTGSTLTTNPTSSITATGAGSTGILLNGSMADLTGTSVTALNTGISATGGVLGVHSSVINATGSTAVAGINTLGSVMASIDTSSNITATNAPALLAANTSQVTASNSMFNIDVTNSNIPLVIINLTNSSNVTVSGSTLNINSVSSAGFTGAQANDASTLTFNSGSVINVTNSNPANGGNNYGLVNRSSSILSADNTTINLTTNDALGTTTSTLNGQGGPLNFNTGTLNVNVAAIPANPFKTGSNVTIASSTCVLNGAPTPCP